MNKNSFIQITTLLSAALAFSSACEQSPSQPGALAQQATQGSIEQATQNFEQLRASQQVIALEDGPSVSPIASFEGTIVKIDRNLSGWFLLLVDPLAREGMNVWISPANLPADSDFTPQWLKVGNTLSVQGRLYQSDFGDVIVARQVERDGQPSDPKEIVIVDGFEESAQGWKPFFAEYDPRFEEDYELSFSLAGLPGNLDRRDGAMRISGENHSDDLFMMVYKKVDGLEPGRKYEVRLSARIASDATKGAIGVGGSPGSSVFVKMGAISHAPERLFRDSFVYANFDKGNQSNGGKDMRVVGDVEISSEQEGVWELLQRNNHDHPIQLRANDNGELWLLVGTDSGFEATTTLYYSSIRARLRPLR